MHICKTCKGEGGSHHHKCPERKTTVPKRKQNKEVREQEFIHSVEQLLGFPLFPWQRERILEMRALSLAGKPIDVCVCSPNTNGGPRSHHKHGCPKEIK